MNREETTKVLTTIAAHYWQATNHLEGRSIDLMVETWTMVLADVPLRPHIETALEWWFKNEKWPPQASELRERAKSGMKAAESSRQSAALLAEYSRPVKQPAPRHIRMAAVARAKAGELSWDDLEREVERLAAECETSDPRERDDNGLAVGVRAGLGAG